MPDANENLVNPPGLDEIIPKRVVFSVPMMDQVKVRKNLVYKVADGKPLTADVYVPAGSDPTERPAVIFIHGGPVPQNLLTPPKEWGIFTSYGQIIAASRLVGVTFNHRFYSGERLDDAQSDVDDLIGYVRENAGLLGVDKDRIAVWAFSGGGPFLSGFLREPRHYICCMVAYYAALDLRLLRAPGSTIEEVVLERYSAAASLSNMTGDSKIAPILIARAGLDNPALNESIERFIHAAISKNVMLDFCNHAGGRHGFDALDDDDRSREIIRHTIDFIRTHS
jgi:acetyl esterase/lipase